ncbi:MAG: hypothetical protein NVS2B7_12050 [Herpetosiphon sp.]
MRYPYERYEVRPRRSGGRCLLIGLIALVWLVLGGVLLVRYVSRTFLTNAVSRRFAQQLPMAQLPSAQPQRLQQLPALPAGTDQLVITEDAANRWLQEHRDQYAGFDNVTLHFMPGVATADVTIRGLTGRLRSGVALQNGRIVAVDPQLSPPLNVLIDIRPFAQLVENRLNQDLASLNRTVKDVRVDEGRLTILMQ